MRQIPQAAAELPPSRETVLICHHGIRSLQAAYFLERAGFADLINPRGSVAAWAEDVDTSMPVY